MILLRREIFNLCIVGTSAAQRCAAQYISDEHTYRLPLPYTNHGMCLFVGFAIGVIPQIRNVMIGDAAPLRVIQDTTNLSGDGAIPALTLIIGGTLLKGLRGSGIQKSVVVGIIIVRYVFLPLTGILIIEGALKFGLVHSDPSYLFVLLIQYTLPPAMNIGTITQLFGAGESECSVIMLWTYVLASVSLTLLSAFFIWFVARL